jgi:ribosomal protein L32
LEPTQVSGYPGGQLSRRRLSRSVLRGDKPLIKEMYVMAVPKRRMSRSTPAVRRAQWKAEATGLVNVSVAGRQHKVRRRLLKAARLGLIDLDKR